MTGYRVTLRDLAERAGVSKSTVSLVLRNSPSVAEHTRRKVRAAIEELGYVYNRGAANLRINRTQTVGLIISDIRNPFFAQLTSGMDQVLDQAGWIVMLANTEESPARQDRVVTRMREYGVDALVLSPAEGTSPDLIATLVASGLPVIQAMRRADTRLGDYVGGDECGAIDLGLDHRTGLGHRRIAFLATHINSSAARARTAQFRIGTAARGLADAEEVRSGQSRAASAAAVSAWLQTRGRASLPTALICHNDNMAIGAMMALTDAGLRPGADMAVLGIDDIDEARMVRPALSTVNLSARQIGIEAARLALRRVNHPDADAESLLMSAKLVVRDTTPAPAPR